MAGAVASSRAPRPSSTSSKAGSTLVPPGANRLRISDTASTASGSATTESSSQVPSADVPPSLAGGRPAPDASAKRVADALEDPAVAVAVDDLAGFDGVGLEELALALRELARHLDLDHHVEVAAIAGPAQMRHAASAQPDLGARLGARP